MFGVERWILQHRREFGIGPDLLFYRLVSAVVHLGIVEEVCNSDSIGSHYQLDGVDDHVRLDPVFDNLVATRLTQ